MISSSVKNTFLSISLKQALSWNYLSFMVLGASGLGATFCVAFYYNATVLGQFSLVNSIYMILMQLSTLGVLQSVLMYLAQEPHQLKRNAEIIHSALLVICLINLPLMLFLYFFPTSLLAKLSLLNLAPCLKVLIPALFLFSMNKVFLWALNGMLRTRTYACIQMLRYSLIFLFVLLASWFKLELIWIVSAYLYAEVVVFIFLMTEFLPILAQCRQVSFDWVAQHIRYGIKGAASGFFLMLNLNIDLIILSLFVTKNLVGIYGLCAAIVIGLYQFLTAIRISVNPVLANCIHHKKSEELYRLIKKSKKVIFAMMSMIAVVILMIFPMIVSMFWSGTALLDSWYLLGILLLGVVVYSVFFPFDQILAMGGFPGQQTLFQITVLLFNIGMNFILIPKMGIYGAAIATTVASSLFAPWMLSWLVKKHLKLQLI